MVEAAQATAGNPTVPERGRVPASTIRALQLFFGHIWALSGTPRQRMAWVFQVHERTVSRWEERGVLPAALPIDPDHSPPDWRRKLLFWLIDQMEKTAVSDTRKTTTTGDVDGCSNVGAVRDP